MSINIEHKTTMNIEGYFDGKLLKTHDCEIGDWWGNDICERVDITREIEEVSLPKGEYKITISFERVGD